MGINNAYFFDSYALVESTQGNPNYVKYLEADVIITMFNLSEYAYQILKKLGEQKAKIAYGCFVDCVEEREKDVLIDAMKFKLQHKKRKLSYADCVGYILAKKLNLKFLTGDKEFEGFSNVEFVK